MFAEMSPVLLWFIVGLVLVIGEIFIPGLIIIFFGAGAWITALAQALGLIESFNEQLLVFLFSSVLSLVIFRRHGQRYFEGRVSGELPPFESIDDFKGGRALVTATITPKRVGGKVEFNGTIWDAEADVELTAGATVQVIARNNLTLKVKPLN